jgi:hypothetical protein
LPKESIFIFMTFYRTVFAFLALEAQLAASRHETEEARRRKNNLENSHESLQRAALGTVRAVLEDRLQAIPARVREVVTHEIHQGAGAALAAAQLRSGRDLRRLEPGFPDDSTPEEQELVGDLEVQMAAAVII